MYLLKEQEFRDLVIKYLINEIENRACYPPVQSHDIESLGSGVEGSGRCQMYEWHPLPLHENLFSEMHWKKDCWSGVNFIQRSSPSLSWSLPIAMNSYSCISVSAWKLSNCSCVSVISNFRKMALKIESYYHAWSLSHCMISQKGNFPFESIQVFWFCVLYLFLQNLFDF